MVVQQGPNPPLVPFSNAVVVKTPELLIFLWLGFEHKRYIASLFRHTTFLYHANSVYGLYLERLRDSNGSDVPPDDTPQCVTGSELNRWIRPQDQNTKRSLQTRASANGKKSNNIEEL